MGSWLSGPRAAAEAAGVDFGYRGERLGLPEHGPGAVAGVGRRLAAITVDWVASLLVTSLLFPGLVYGSVPYSFVTLAVFAVQVAVLTWLTGASFGHRLLGMRVVRVGSGAPPGPRRAVVRTALLVLVLPAFVWDRDQRGLHDKAAGTVLVRT